MTLGHEYPSARFFWRIEPDVCFSGALSMLIQRTAADPADLLLHKYQSEKKDMAPTLPDGRPKASEEFFSHWPLHANSTLLRAVPPSRRLRALVSVGRYSTRFLHLLRRHYWNTAVGFEEILLPVACAAAAANVRRFGPCTMSALSSGAGVTSHRMASHFQYRPAFACTEFRSALAAQTNELWHPIKERSCVADYLESH